MAGLTLCFLENPLGLRCELFLLPRLVPLGENDPPNLQDTLSRHVQNSGMKCSFCRLDCLYLSTCCMARMSSPCSSSRPCSFSLFASCCAFFFSRQARLASLFFSLRDFVLWESLSAQSSKPNVKHVIKIYWGQYMTDIDVRFYL